MNIMVIVMMRLNANHNNESDLVHGDHIKYRMYIYIFPAKVMSLNSVL